MKQWEKWTAIPFWGVSVTPLVFLKDYNSLLELDSSRSINLFIPKTYVSNLGLYVTIYLWFLSLSICFWESKHSFSTFQKKNFLISARSVLGKVSFPHHTQCGKMKGFWKKNFFLPTFTDFSNKQTLSTGSFKDPFICNFKELFWKVYM